MKLNSIKRR